LHYPAVVSDRLQTISARYLSEDERIMIADLNRVGVTVRAIAGEVGRSPSTISRELRRNRDDAGRYRPLAAHRLAAERRSRPRDRRVVVDVELREFVQGLLTVRRSPEQISHALHERFVGDPSRQLVAESVYQALYDRDSVLLRDRSCVVLRTGRRRRRPHRQPDARRAGSLAQMTMIDQRPASAEDRVELVLARIRGHVRVTRRRGSRSLRGFGGRGAVECVGCCRTPRCSRTAWLGAQLWSTTWGCGGSRRVRV
jgi:transposase, IS30 family